MSTFQFHFPASAGATVTIPLPEELRGEPLKIVVEKETTKAMRAVNTVPELVDDDFYRFKPLKEILEEQGAKTVVSLDELIPSEPAWDSQDEFFEFLEAIGEDVDNYR